MIMKKALTTAILLAAAAVCVSGTARASGIPYNTGVDVVAGVDQAWTIVSGASVPPLTYPSNAYTNASNGTFPIPPWVSNSATSSWDTPFNPLNSDTDPSGPGTYNYQTTFTTTGVDLLSGMFAADNEVGYIKLDGRLIYTGPSDGSSQFASWTDFSGLTNSGTNTILFDVVNYAQDGGNPSGLNVEFTGLTTTDLTSPTPLPGALPLFAGGLGVIGMFGARKRRKIRASAV